jgi:DNA-binding CsgD family transcriptional regulator
MAAKATKVGAKAETRVAGAGAGTGAEAPPGAETKRAGSQAGPAASARATGVAGARTGQTGKGKPAIAAVYGSPVLILGSSSFFALVLPCFFKLTNSGSADTFYHNPSFQVFVISLLVGCVVAGLLMVLLGTTGLLKHRLEPVHLLIGSGCFLLGYLPVLISLFVDIPRGLLYLGGALYGVGVVFLAIAWSLLVVTVDFRGLMGGCALGFLLALALILLINASSPAVACTLTVLLLLVTVALPLNALRKTELRFPSADRDAALDIEDGVFLKNTSLVDLLLILSTPTLGLMLLIVLSISGEHRLGFLDTSTSTTGLALASLILLLLTRAKLRRSFFPLLYWVVFPAIAGILIVLDSFPISSEVFTFAVHGVFFFCSLLGLFAVSFLLTVNNQGEFSPLSSLGISLALMSLAALFGHMMLNSGLDTMSRGELALSFFTLYFVFLLISPALQLWRTRKELLLKPHVPTAWSDEQFVNSCDTLADGFGLSRREREVFLYLSRGYNSPYIAGALVISESTVRSHIKSIYKKMGISSRMDIIELFDTQQNQPKN